MRFILLAIALSALFAPAMAQTAAPPDRETGLCAQALDGGGAILKGRNFAVRGLHAGCAMSDAIFSTGTMVRWSFDGGEIEGDRFHDVLADLAGKEPDIGRVLDSSLPQWGRISAHGIRMSLDVDDARMKYMSSVQQWPLEIAASYRYDPKDGYLHIQNAEISGVKLGKAAISAELNLPAGSSIGMLAPNPEATLSHLRLRLDNQGLWENLAMPSLSAFAMEMLAEDADPEAAVARLRDSAGAAVRLLPESRIDAASKKALLHFIQDMPNPTGFFTLDLDFKTPLPVGGKDLDPLKIAQAAMAGATMTVTYKAR